MTKSDREALLSVGALAVLLFVCANAVGFSWQARSDAASEFDLRGAQLSQLEAHAANRNKARLSGAAAPPAAFLAAPTQGLAGAQLQAYLQHVADTYHATLISSGMEATKHEDQPDSIRLQATLDANLQALQALLYQLESGTPYVFVDSLNIQIPGTNAPHAVEDPLFRVTLGLRAVWRHETT
ncbi:MAG: type II secretion system protein GspM [Xanthobacteraceae bacterium]